MLNVKQQRIQTGVSEPDTILTLNLHATLKERVLKARTRQRSGHHEA
jgi:hypothetical protein